MTNIKSNYYEILNVTPQATLEELKMNYKQLILQCHPDKLQQQQKHEQEFENSIKNLEITNDPNSLKFVTLTEAWNCLKDPIKRKQYDAELLLNKFHTHNNIYAHIKLKDMKKVTNIEDYYFHDNHDDDVDVDDEEKEIENSEDLEMKKSKENETPKYLYIYDCRCGGQYIVDESAEQYCHSDDNYQHYNDDYNDDTQIKNDSSDKNIKRIVVVGDDNDDADHNTQNNKNSSNTNENKNNGGAGTVGSNGGNSEGVVFLKQHNNDDETPPPPPPLPPAGKPTAAELNYEDNDGELIVECSECSLVIILNG